AAVEEANAKPVFVMNVTPPSIVRDSTSQPAQPSSTSVLPWLIAATIVALATALYLTVRPPARSDLHTLRFSLSPPNGYALEAGISRQTFARSPAGARSAFSAMDSGGVFQAFVRDLDALESRSLPNSRGSYNVFWAADGRSLFLAVGGSLRRYAVDGDSYQVICETPAI